MQEAMTDTQLLTVYFNAGRSFVPCGFLGGLFLMRGKFLISCLPSVSCPSSHEVACSSSVLGLKNEGPHPAQLCVVTLKTNSIAKWLCREAASSLQDCGLSLAK